MEYKHLWDSMVVRLGAKAAITTTGDKMLVFQDRYKKVADVIGCPWYFIACIHYRESSLNFSCVLHNGEKIIGTNNKTKLVPKGKGPFKTWEDAAIDALILRRVDEVKHWDVEVLLRELEEYNGVGYRKYHEEVPTPYLWSGTNHYGTPPAIGKYTADGSFKKHNEKGEIIIDKQLGCAPLLKYILEKL